ncbi:MAG TPA: amino acid racemase [Nocardioides sp.]|nr:amino acid racemase [Nocardioides sp.]
MQTIGLIGGLSWYSTAAYYQVINEQVQQRRGGHASAEIALQSLDFSKVREMQQRGAWGEAGAMLAGAGRRCEAAGADLLLICSNLMHRVADEVQDAVDIPLLRITDAIAARARAEGHNTLGLLGTRWVMEEDFYVGSLASTGLTVEVPAPGDRELVDRVIFDELTQGEVRPDSRTAYGRVAADLAARGAQAIVLGCTEIELLLGPDDVPVPLLDSMRVHAEAAVDAALEPQAVGAA